MADTKVSGLAAAASFLTTHEFPVNEAGTSKKVTGAQIKAAVAQGTLASGYAQVTANQGTFTAVTDLTSLTVTVTPVSGRRLRITGMARFQSSVGNDYAALSIYEGATALHVAEVSTGATSGRAPVVSSMAIVTPTAAAHTYKLTGERTSGTGNITMTASTQAPAFILVEDIGV